MNKSSESFQRRLLDDADAPTWTYRSVDMLDGAGLARAKAFGAEVATAPPWRPGTLPAWVQGFVDRCVREVPAHRAHRLPPGAPLAAFPTTDRTDLARHPELFVPDDADLEDLVVYESSGTTGGRIVTIPSRPWVSAAQAVLHRAALALHGVAIEGGPGRVSVALVCSQVRTITFPAVLSILDGAAMAKVNLTDPKTVAYLDKVRPEVLTGDPVALADLAATATTVRPKAIVTTSSALLPGLAARLQERFGCPALDLYALSESGPVAVGVDGGHALLQPRLLVEILDDAGRPAALGERGEIVLTGGHDDLLPLLRYRTGDTAALGAIRGRGALLGLEGRRPARFVAADGTLVGTPDLARGLALFPLAAFQLHQAVDGSLTLHLRPDDPVDREAVTAAVRELLGDRPLVVADLDTGRGQKVLQWRGTRRPSSSPSIGLSRREPGASGIRSRPPAATARGPRRPDRVRPGPPGARAGGGGAQVVGSPRRPPDATRSRQGEAGAVAPRGARRARCGRHRRRRGPLPRHTSGRAGRHLAGSAPPGRSGRGRRHAPRPLEGDLPGRHRQPPRQCDLDRADHGVPSVRQPADHHEQGR